MKYNPFCPTEIAFKDIKGLKNTLLSLDVSNIVIIMSESLSSRMHLSAFVHELRSRCEIMKGTLHWINTISPNPTPTDIFRSLNHIADSQIDTIIAIGGGSVIDLAKAVNAFYKKGTGVSYSIDSIKNDIKNKKYMGREYTDIICVPSTAGTGSEVTQWATIWDKVSNSKLSIDDPGLKPKLALIVPELTLSMPAHLTLSTGLDAMCHSVEAYWSKHTTPIVQEIAYSAIETIIHNLGTVVNQPNCLKARANLCKASVLSGLAFSQTRTTACHSISYPLTIHHDIPHGLAASITLDAVGQLNKGHFPNDTSLLFFASIFCRKLQNTFP